MENKNLLIATVFVLMTMMVVPLVSAAALTTTLYTPVNFTNWTGSVTYNCTTPSFNVLNITIDANSSAGVMTELGTAANTSLDQTVWEGSVTITSANDGTGYNISCFVENATSSAYSAEIAATGIMLDSTNPSCSMSILHPRIAYKGLQKIEYSSSDAIELVSTLVDVDGPGKQVLVTATAANGPLELASNDTKYIGTWDVNMTATDRAGNICTDGTDTFKSYLPSGEEADEDEGKGVNKNFILLLAVIGLIWWFTNKK